MISNERIPNRIIFIWFGPRLNFASYLAVASAVMHCRPERVDLIVDGLEESDPITRLIAALDGVHFRRNPRDMVASVPRWGPQLTEVYDDLERPEAKANLVRLAALQTDGGVYLDFDTLTVRDLGPLRCEYEGFIGLEHVTVPALSRVPKWLSHPSRVVRQKWRGHLARHPEGVARFRRAEAWYPRAVNNAVLGSSADNPAIGAALRAMAEVPAGDRRTRFILGTHLMQRVTQNRTIPGLTVLSPSAFYPLGPRISRHWFVEGSKSKLGEYLTPETFVIHWYNSNEKDVGSIDPAWVENKRESVAFAHLASDLLNQISP